MRERTMTAKRLALNAAAAFTAGLVLGALVTIAPPPSGVRTTDVELDSLIERGDRERQARDRRPVRAVRTATAKDSILLTPRSDEAYAVAIRRAIAVAAHARQDLTAALKDLSRPPRRRHDQPPSPTREDPR